MLVGCWIVASGIASAVYAGVCSHKYGEISSPITADSVKIELSRGADSSGNLGTIDQGAANEAAANWNGACSGSAIPQITADQNATGDWAVDVTFWPGKNDRAPGKPTDCVDVNSSCGCAKASFSGGKLLSVQVHLFETQSNGTSCASSYSNVLTHELGHGLGLQDETDSACDGHIMGSVTGNIESEECQEVEKNWDRDPHEGPDGPGGDGPCVV
jgi:predicted Zn-dependent protease